MVRKAIIKDFFISLDFWTLIICELKFSQTYNNVHWTVFEGSNMGPIQIHNGGN